MILYIVCAVMSLAWLSGFALFRRKKLKDPGGTGGTDPRISVIIPARNEEKNLPHLLGSLENQTLKPHEIIVVDDFSSDGTSSVAVSYDGVTVMAGSELPPGWTGKTWAVWNGYLRSTGDVLIFLDADVRLSPMAVERLVTCREQTGGVISVVPYHHTERLYERLSLLAYLLGVFAFTSPFERRNRAKGLYGSCIVASREDYERVGGHDGIRCEVLDDLNLGRKFTQAGIPVNNFIGCGLVSFRMYPYGLKSQLQGFAKGAVLSTATLMPATVTLVACWLVGLLAAEFATPFLLAFSHPWAYPFVGAYLLYTLQIFYFLRYTGRYGVLIPVFHGLSSLFFLIVMAYSVYQVSCLGSVSWKGRRIDLGVRKEP